MYNDSKYSGKHLVCDFKDIQNIQLLHDKNELENICRNICKK